jgi:hypothetical protein
MPYKLALLGQVSAPAKQYFSFQFCDIIAQVGIIHKSISPKFGDTQK